VHGGQDRRPRRGCPGGVGARGPRGVRLRVRPRAQGPVSGGPQARRGGPGDGRGRDKQRRVPVEVQGRGHGAAVAPRPGDAGHRHAEPQLLQGGGGPVDGAAHHPHPGLLPRLRLHPRAPLRQVRQLPDRRHHHRGRGPGPLREAPHSHHRDAHRRGHGARPPRQDRDPPLLRGRRRGGALREPPWEHARALLQRRGAHGGVAQAEPQ